MPQNEEKLELFKQAILERASAQSRKIQQETEEAKKHELDQEESKLLDSFYCETQAKINKIKTDNTKELGRVSARLKKELYAQREQYLSEMLARVRVELSAFVQTEKYPAFLDRKAAALCGQWEGGCLRVRPADLVHRAVLEKYGRPVEGDNTIQLGGVILSDPENGVVIDESLDAALESQRQWFQRNSGFQAEGGR